VSPTRLAPSNLRAALWTLRAARVAKKQISDGRWDAVALPRVPAVPHASLRAVESVLRRTRTMCLPAAIVRQAWFASHGAKRDLVVGVTAPSRGFEAHAWLEGDPPCHAEHFQELLRRPATA
jgi:transglutaminase superfamily protein